MIQDCWFFNMEDVSDVNSELSQGRIRGSPVEKCGVEGMKGQIGGDIGGHLMFDSGDQKSVLNQRHGFGVTEYGET